MVLKYFSVESTVPSEWTRNFFTPVAVVLLFNLGDLVGRSLATFIVWPKKNLLGQLGVLMFCAIRVGFIPLFMYCNIAPESRTLPVAIRLAVSFHFILSPLAYNACSLVNNI